MYSYCSYINRNEIKMGRAFIDHVTKLIGTQAVVTDRDEIAIAAQDWRGRYEGEALCILYPANMDELSKVLKLCYELDIAVVPQGGNTSLCGGSVPQNADDSGKQAVIIGLKRLNHILNVDVISNTIEVEAGCILANIHEAAKEVDRYYPISLGAEGSCQIGGTIATNAGGTSVLRYGNTRENVLGLEVVLADGSIWSGLNGLRKNNTGYDLKQLFIGAEGTLGIITKAVLKLHPLPHNHALAWLGFSSLDSVLKLLPLFQQACGAKLSAFELMNDFQLDLVVEFVADRRSPLQEHHNWHLLIELSDNTSDAALNDLLQTVLEQAFENELVDDAIIALSQKQYFDLWEIRHSVSEANKKAGIGLTTDCAVPLSAIVDFIEDATTNVHAIIENLPIIIVAHLGDGNIHFIPFLSFDVWEKCENREQLAQRLRRAVDEAALSYKGTFSAEHGIGRMHLPEMAHFKSDVELKMMRAIKSAFDAKNIMNPGVLLPDM